jgi:hypothetical protein
VDWKRCGVDAITPPALLSLCGEHLSRRTRAFLRSRVGSDLLLTRNEAKKIVKRLLGIEESTCPDVLPILEDEPPTDIVLESCSGEYTVNATPTWNPFDFADNELIAIRKVVDFATALHAVCLPALFPDAEDRWAQLESCIEAGGEGLDNLVGRLAKELQDRGSSIDGPRWTQGWLEKEGANGTNAERTVLALVVQSLLFHTSGDRKDLQDVRDGETMRGFAKEMRMDVYRARLSEKRKEESKVAGGMIFTMSTSATIDEFAAMMPSHAHGLTSEKFWGFARATKRDKAKANIFLKLCNQPFHLGKRYGKL